MKRHFQEAIRLWLPVVVWCLLLYYLSSIPSLKTSQNPDWDRIIRNFLHLGFYFVLYLLFFRAINFSRKKKNYWLPFLLSCGYGLFDEVHQFFVPTRTFQYEDLGFDATGSILAGIFLGLLIPRTPIRYQKLVNRFIYQFE